MDVDKLRTAAAQHDLARRQKEQGRLRDERLGTDPETGQTYLIGDDPRHPVRVAAGPDAVYTPNKPITKTTITTTTPKKKRTSTIAWRPDFTKDNPYEGAPPEYIALVNKGFVPTIENPLPPYAGHVVDSDSNLFLDDTGRRVQVYTQEQAELLVEGIDARSASKSNDIFKSQNIELADGQWMDRDKFADLPKEYRDIGTSRGYDAMLKQINADNAAAEKQQKTQEAALKALEPYKSDGETLHGPFMEGGKVKAGKKASDTYDIHQYLRLGGSKSVLRDAGFPVEVIDKAIEDNKQDIGIDEHRRQYFADRGWSLELPDMNDPDRDRKQKEFQKQWGSATDDYLIKHNKTKLDLATDFGIQVAEAVVPGVYVARNWSKLSAGEKALWLAIDIVSVIPFVPAAASGARSVATAGRLARLGGAAKGLGREAVAQIRAPIDIIAHPVGTAKASVRQIREVTENILHPHKLPEAVITTSNSTVRLRVTEATTPEQAKKIRDEMMDLAAKGEKPIVEVGGVKYELSRSPLMEELKGGLAHATPSGEAFEKGLTVKRKPGMPSQEQGLFLSHEPLPRFVESSAFGMKGEKPAMIILSPETAKKAISTDKLYRGPQGLVAEMERKLPVGINLDAPKQKLFTRVGPNKQRAEIWLEKPLTKGQIAKLKALDLVEQIKTPFKPAIVISHTDEALDAAKMRALNALLKESGNDDIARLLARTDRALKAGTRAAPAVTRTAARKDAALTTADRAAQRTEGISTRVKASPDEIRAAAAGETARTGRAMAGTNTTPVRADTERTGTRTEDVRSDRTTADITRAGTARVEAPRTEPLRTDTTRIDTPRTEPPRIDTTRIDTPKTEPPRRSPPSREPPEPIDPIRPPRGGDTPTGKTDGDGKPSQFLTEEEIASAVAVQRGAFVRVFKDPYGPHDVVTYVKGKEPPGIMLVPAGKGSAYRSVQLYIGKNAPKKLRVDEGIMDMTIIKPASPGKLGTIKFAADHEQTTKLPITVKKGVMVSTRKNRQYETRTANGGKLLSRDPVRGAKVRNNKRRRK